ncbi:peptidoglycan DD-metalloendopeptidase family protein [Marinicella rhabdoformis]|uniref:peptidoglycan DD-metalloendopeptidase family protein n=1 Tax=Marinicella rhabdoformis TaxID=2580566 RepID=UPI0012AED927|nr:peptidoglycan DD-metalloendopeptidase family protein [Marinicella rhabdoformis]
MMIRLVLLTLVLSLLSACGSKKRPARVDEINTKKYAQSSKVSSRRTAQRIENKKNRDQYQVRKGDTLYSIGFKYDLDYKFLAQINNISKPYRIYPGQTLKLKSDSKKSYVTTQPLKTNPIVTNHKIQAKPLANSQGSQYQPAKVSSKPVVKKPVAVATKPAIKPTNNPTNQSTVKPATKPAVKPKAIAAKTPAVKSGNITWSWPTAGKIRSTFLASNPARKGISIGGKEGQAVKAAAPGVVVYSGSGLLGYGELIIIKHNDQFLSAYGHNKKRLVTEGDVIKVGQTIAELGSSGTNVNNLHFEIRKNGKPVNPLNYVKP